MADYINIETLADNLNSDLNTISATLYGNSVIAREIPFNVVGNIQDYEDSKQWATDVIVPAIMINATNNVSPSQVYQSYNQTVIIDMYAFTRELSDVLNVINTYVQENAGKFTKSNGWTYQQNVTLPDVLGRVIDEGEERVTVRFNITYSFVQNGYMSDDVTITIDGEELPVISYVHKLVKSGISTSTIIEAGKTKRKNKDGFISKSLTIIHQNTTAMNKIHEDIDTGDFLNRTYAFVYTLGSTDYTNSESLVLVDGTIRYTENGFVLIDAVFELALDLS